jgi:hypothetical protein
MELGSVRHGSKNTTVVLYGADGYSGAGGVQSSSRMALSSAYSVA